MARIALTSSSISVMRRSDWLAFFRRKMAQRCDSTNMPGTALRKTRMGINASLPIRNKTIQVITGSSINDNEDSDRNFGALSILFTSLDTKSITWPVENSCSFALLTSGICKQNNTSWKMFKTSSLYGTKHFAKINRNREKWKKTGDSREKNREYVKIPTNVVKMR